MGQRTTWAIAGAGVAAALALAGCTSGLGPVLATVFPVGIVPGLTPNPNDYFPLKTLQEWKFTTYQNGQPLTGQTFWDFGTLRTSGNVATIPLTVTPPSGTATISTLVRTPEFLEQDLNGSRAVLLAYPLAVNQTWATAFGPAVVVGTQDVTTPDGNTTYSKALLVQAATDSFTPGVAATQSMWFDRKLGMVVQEVDKAFSNGATTSTILFQPGS